MSPLRTRSGARRAAEPKSKKPKSKSVSKRSKDTKTRQHSSLDPDETGPNVQGLSTSEQQTLKALLKKQGIASQQAAKERHTSEYCGIYILNICKHLNVSARQKRSAAMMLEEQAEDSDEDEDTRSPLPLLPSPKRAKKTKDLESEGDTDDDDQDETEVDGGKHSSGRRGYNPASTNVIID